MHVMLPIIHHQRQGGTGEHEEAARRRPRSASIVARRYAAGAYMTCGVAQVGRATVPRLTFPKTMKK